MGYSELKAIILKGIVLGALAIWAAVLLIAFVTAYLISTSATVYYMYSSAGMPTEAAVYLAGLTWAGFHAILMLLMQEYGRKVWDRVQALRKGADFTNGRP